MNAEIYAEWLRRQGQRVIRTKSSYWHGQGWGVFQAFPYHWLIDPGRAELRDLMLRHGALALRYSTPAPDGQIGDGQIEDGRNGDGRNQDADRSRRQTRDSCYHVVYTGDDYGFETLGAWTRKNVRRGLRNCSIEPISSARYLEQGWELRLDTLARQRRRVRETKRRWQSRYAAASGLDGFEFWAAEVRGRLAATLVTFPMDGWAYMLYQQCHSDYLREHVNNALSFVVTQTLIRRPHIHAIFYGMQSLDAPASVDEFKFRMGYEAKTVGQRIAFHPCLAPLVNHYTHRAARYLRAWNPASRVLAKAEGLFRFGLAARDASWSSATASPSLPESKA